MWRPTDFDRARADFLEAMVAELNLPLFKLVHEYNNNAEFKRRVAPPRGIVGCVAGAPLFLSE